MYTTNNKIRIIFIVIYLLISVGALLSSIYILFLTILAVGFGGGEFILMDWLWTWKGIITLFIFSTITFIGLIKQRKIGVIFGYSIPIAMALISTILIIDSAIAVFNNELLNLTFIIFLIIKGTLILGITILSIFGLNKIRTQYFNFNPADYGVIMLLTITLLISWYQLLVT